MKRLLIRNGRVVDPSQGLDQGMDVLVEDGVISSVSERLDAPGDVEIFDAAGYPESAAVSRRRAAAASGRSST